jgi:pimeloyl-ACP methyl ester carboxylesterase
MVLSGDKIYSSSSHRVVLEHKPKHYNHRGVSRYKRRRLGPAWPHLLHEPSEPLIDLVFVHGLGGGSRRTWSKTPHVEHYWPQHWLPKEPRFKNMRVHTFGYESSWRKESASILTIDDFGQALLAEIHNSLSLNKDQNDTPIVLVGHSMGGILIKKAVLLPKQDPTYANVASRIHSIFFLATPHRGVDVANLLGRVLKLVVSHGSKAYVDSLTLNSQAILTINDRFRQAYQGIQLRSFIETLPTDLGLVVDK